jgi:hypothetical protein
MDDESVADQMNRAMYLNPGLIDDENPRLAQARKNVAEEVEKAEQRKEDFQAQVRARRGRRTP